MFFNEGWVDYDDRQNYLLESDIGVSTHLDHIETAFSFRTRILDYLWASLPIVATAGDSFADIDRTIVGSGSRSRRATSMASRRRCSACSTTPSSSSVVPRAIERVRAHEFRWSRRCSSPCSRSAATAAAPPTCSTPASG